MESRSGISVLYIEDSDSDGELVRHHLTHSNAEGFSLIVKGSLTDGLKTLRAESFGVILLDLSLPDSRGLETLSTLRGVIADTPVIVVTGATEESLGIQAVRLGADDYLPKSDLTAEILSRSILFAIERRRRHFQQANLPTNWVIDGLMVDLERQILSIQDSQGGSILLNVTPIEFRICVLLTRHRGQVLSRGRIVSEVWGPDANEISFRTVDRHVSSLKRKAPLLERNILSVYGAGYSYGPPTN